MESKNINFEADPAFPDTPSPATLIDLNGIIVQTGSFCG